MRVWKMHFLPAVELLAKFPCVDCTESPSSGTNQLFKFLLLRPMGILSMCRATWRASLEL